MGHARAVRRVFDVLRVRRRRPRQSSALFGLLLFVLALAGVIVWVTARDIAGDEPPGRRQ
jgi:hypothetical protein